ncbi:MAG: AI-2E family transporter [Rhodospirillales bacterium]|nr:AI-2E family transporter [Rhodospirillales bacterium]
MTVTWKTELRFWLIAFAVFFAAIYLLRGILLPFVAGMAVAYLLDPVCDWLEGKGLSRALATTLLTLVFLLLAVGGVLLLVPLIVGQLTGLIAQVPGYIKSLVAQLQQLLQVIETRFDPELLAQIQGALAGLGKKLVEWSTAALVGLASRGAAFANLLSLVVITPVVTFYLLRDWDRIVERVDSWLPKHMAGEIREQIGNVDRMLAGFVRGQSSVCLILGVFYALALTLAGLDFGLLIGMVAGVLTFIPFVGSAVGLVASVGMALVQFDDWLRIGIVAAIFVVGQVLEGNFLTPKLVGDRVGLHPVWVIFALLAGGFLFGFVGVLLAVPVAAVIGVLIRFMLSRYLDSVYYLGTASSTPPAESAAADDAEA